MVGTRAIDNKEMEQRLIARREEVVRLRAESSEAAHPVELDQARVGRLSRMDALQMQAMAAETTRRRDAELDRIAAALARIEDGEFGWCLGCGEEIGEKRLLNDPAVPNCIGCAGKSGG